MQYQIEDAVCEICGSNNHTIVWNKTEREQDKLLTSKLIRNTDGSIVNGINVICNKCGLIYVTPRMTKESSTEFYKNDYRKIYGENMEIVIEKQHAMVAFELLRGTSPKTHLDIGASTGQLVNLCASNDIDSIGVECNKRNSEYAQNQGTNVINMDFDEYETDKKFDVVTILNTLEHMYSPLATLKKIHKLLNDDKILIISVPYIYNLNLKKPMDAYLSNAHLYNFSITTLDVLLKKAGFQMLSYIFVPEQIGDKLYVIAHKVDEHKYDDQKFEDSKINPEVLKTFFTAADLTFLIGRQLF